MAARQATGAFEVTMTPVEQQAHAGGVTTARLTLRKSFSGDLVASSAGEMLTARTAVPGSAGYVAIERVEGTLHGRAGAFVFQHSGTMSRAGGESLALSVVPDSGTGDLAGIAGTFAIKIDAGKHTYVFDYTLP